MSNKTYAEQEGKSPFNWWDALNNPLKYEYSQLFELAGNWVTCACGNQCATLPRDENGWPEDDILFSLGNEFADLVEAEEYDDAKRVLEKIEQRSATLLAEIDNKK